MGIATRIAVRLTPDPPCVATMLCAFDSVDAAAATVSGIIAAGVLPAALEMMDARITQAVEDFVGAGYPRDAEAVLLAEVDGLEDGVARTGRRDRRVAHANGATLVRVAADDAERALLWKGRKSAFGAIARIAPDYYLHDAVVPRTKLVEVLAARLRDRRRARADRDERLPRRRRQPASAARVRSPRARASGTACTRPGPRSSTRASTPGGVLTGEHGVGIEKRDLMPRMFSVDDLDAQARLRDAFDPDGAANPEKVLPRGQPLRRDPARAGGHMDMIAPAPASRRSARARSGRSADRRRRTRSRCARPRASSRTNPPT